MAQTPPTIGPFKRIVNVGWGGPVGILDIVSPTIDYQLKRVIPATGAVNVPLVTDQDPEPSGSYSPPSFVDGDEIIKKDGYPDDPDFWSKVFIVKLDMGFNDVELAGYFVIARIVFTFLPGTPGYADVGGTDYVAAFLAAGGTLPGVVPSLVALGYQIETSSNKGIWFTYDDPGFSDYYDYITNIGNPTHLIGSHISANLAAWDVCTNDPHDPPDPDHLTFTDWSAAFAPVRASRKTWLINFAKLGIGGEVQINQPFDQSAAGHPGVPFLRGPYDSTMTLNVYQGGKLHAGPDGTVTNTDGTLLNTGVRTVSYSTMADDIFRFNRTGFL